ncbi:MAG: gamma-glutamyltransferase, partial [Halioglobus sp.]|nr:gamma-glutamyltransferase [Halioglobus sp.]
MKPDTRYSKRRMGMLKLAAATLLLIPGCIAIILYTSRPQILPYQGLTGTARHAVHGREFAVVTGTPWATDAAVDILEENGTACDAAIGALLVINVTHGEAAAFGGVAPTLYFDSVTQQVKSYVGVGTAPARASLAYFADKGHDYIPSLDI